MDINNPKRRDANLNGVNKFVRSLEYQARITWLGSNTNIFKMETVEKNEFQCEGMSLRWKNSFVLDS